MDAITDRARELLQILQRNSLAEKRKEAAGSIAPIVGLVLIVCCLFAPIPSGALSAFLFGAGLLIVGMSLFGLGTELAMTPIGEAMGGALTRTQKVRLIALVGFFIGAMVTIAEPDLSVLAENAPSVPKLTLVLCVAVGVGFFLVVALLRILFQVKLRTLLFISYGIIFLVSIFVPRGFLAVAFDAGGVTTGPMTVPFILGLGTGVASIRSDAGAENDSFGLVSLCSAGPILSVMLLSVFFHAEDGAASPIILTNAADSKLLFSAFLTELPVYLKDVGFGLLPIIAFFIAAQVLALHMPKSRLIRIALGLLYTYAGLVVFLLGVNVGFLPVGYTIGKELGGTEVRWLLIPLGMLFGWFTVSAEPAVQVLCGQVYDTTAGTIPKQALRFALSIGVALSVGLALLRALTGLPVMAFILPGYAVAFLLTFFVPPVFTAIAFDSGGVASGPMTAAFLLPLALGTCVAAGRDPAADAFGLVAMVAMTPLIAIQLLGLLYRRKLSEAAVLAEPEEIIELM